MRNNNLYLFQTWQWYQIHARIIIGPTVSKYHIFGDRNLHWVVHVCIYMHDWYSVYLSVTDANNSWIFGRMAVHKKLFIWEGTHEVMQSPSPKLNLSPCPWIHNVSYTSAGWNMHIACANIHKTHLSLATRWWWAAISYTTVCYRSILKWKNQSAFIVWTMVR